MNCHQIAAVQHSWDELRANGTEAGVLFHYHLLRAQPSLQRVITGGIDECARHWADTVSCVIDSLHDPDQLKLQLRAHGPRQPVQIDRHHFRAGCDALLRALDECLGESYTADVQQAWVAAWRVLATILLRACARPLTNRAAA